MSSTRGDSPSDTSDTRLNPSQYAYSLHTIFNQTTHGAYGKGWTDACLFISEKLREQAGAPESSREQQS